MAEEAEVKQPIVKTTQKSVTVAHDVITGIWGTFDFFAVLGTIYFAAVRSNFFDKLVMKWDKVLTFWQSISVYAGWALAIIVGIALLAELILGSVVFYDTSVPPYMDARLAKFKSSSKWMLLGTVGVIVGLALLASLGILIFG